MRILKILFIGIISVTLLDCKNKTKAIQLDTFSVDTLQYEQVCYTKTLKITQYYCPEITGYVYSKEGYTREFSVGKYKVFFKEKDYKKLTIEGFIKVIYIDNNNKSHIVYLDHNRKIQPYIKNAIGGKLKIGDVACNFLPIGTKVLIDGIEKKVTDRGSGVEGIDVFVNPTDYKNLTVYKTVTIYPIKSKA